MRASDSFDNKSYEHIALFVDLDNFVGFCLGLGLPLDITPAIDRLTELGKITIRKSFGDIFKLPISKDQKLELRKMLQRNLVQHEDTPYQNEFKNSSDIRLVIEALSMAFSNKDIDMFAVIASDRNYLPLFSKLREIGKEIIGIAGNRENTPELYVKACDYFYYHENLTNSAPSAVELDAMLGNDSNLSDTEPGTHIKHHAEHSNKEESFKLLVDAITALEARSGSTIGASVIQMIRRLKPDFDLATYGYKTFKGLCELAASEGLVTIERAGTAFILKVCAKPEPIELPKLDIQSEPINSQLLDWIENKLRVRLPSYKERKAIYQQLVAYKIDENGISLMELTKAIVNSVPDEFKISDVCYKILYSLFRANCFSCKPGESPYNPIIMQLKSSTEEYENVFVLNTIRVFSREEKAPIDASAWSEVLYGDSSKGELIIDISRMI